MKHISVLLNESVDGLNIKAGDVIVDGTLGWAGHSLEILRRFGDSITLICFDLDKDAILRSKELIGEERKNVFFINRSFDELDLVLNELGLEKVDKILLDLGISSFQLEESGRGFTFQKNEPLLMTMKKNPTDEDLTAHEIVNHWSEETLADIIYGFGEERFARKIAKAITLAREEREITNTSDLVSIIEKAVGGHYRGKKINPATKTFQALRIATNLELPRLENILNKGFERLSKEGRFSIITFHSLEDRIVKKTFVGLSKSGLAINITKKPIIPSSEEIKNNPRSRSAKLRLLEKI